MDSSSPAPLDRDTLATREHRNGLTAAVVAHAIWGLLPLYLRLLSTVPALQIMVHRLVWCCIVVVSWLWLRGGLAPVRAALRDPATRWRLAASAALISINWLGFTWSVNNGHVVEVSLGYFINPLLNVAIGVALLGEKLTPARWFAVLLAAVGVGYLTLMQGRFPSIALVVGMSFAIYGLIRKVIPVEAIDGLAAETVLLMPLGIAYLLWCEWTGTGVVGNGQWSSLALLAASGLITAVPLGLFSYGARRIPYSTIGLIQYLGPTIQIMLGIFVFREMFSHVQAVSYGLIWIALAIYAADGLRRSRTAVA
ncbi:MAG: EamA family transporter RarD [Steroidobacteraceae bacterium]